MKLPKLYKKTSIGQDQYWEIEAKGPTIITRYGKVGGKEVVTEDTIKEGKNLGKANATTPSEQAQLEADAIWEKKLKKGYMVKLGDAQKGKTVHEGGCFPMLAKKYADRAHKVVFPAFVQPKLDGHRCICDADGNLWSRSRARIASLPHISTAFVKANIAGMLDGELYNHTHHDKFQELTHLIKRDEPAEGGEIVQYHVYDMVDPTMTFKERLAWLRKVFPKKSDTLVLVETIEVADEDELMEAFLHFREQGYEGAILRNAAGLYVHKRSDDLLKLKEFDDAEFLIIGFEEGRGKLQGHVGKFICQLPNDTFKVKMKGENSRLREFFNDHTLWEGKILQVQYQGFTNKGKPRIPIGLRFREDL